MMMIYWGIIYDDPPASTRKFSGAFREGLPLHFVRGDPFERHLAKTN